MTPPSSSVMALNDSKSVITRWSMRTLVSCSTVWMTGAGPAHHDGLIRSLPVARDVHPGVVRNREEGRVAEISRDVDEHDRVGGLGPRRPLGGVARRGPAVGPHHQGA